VGSEEEESDDSYEEEVSFSQAMQKLRHEVINMLLNEDPTKSNK